MASERGLRLGVMAGAAALAGLAACAVTVTDSPRLLVLCALGAVAATMVSWRCLEPLRLPVARPESPAAASAWPASASVLALEARLEHAPIALFRIDGMSGPDAVVPLNANARRLVAPGRASEPETLYRLLAAQPADERSLVSFDTERGLERAMVAVSTLTVQGHAQRLVALMPVESQLEAEALNAWRQLVHVLTHEIMNSLTPVASLSRTAHDLLGELAADLPADAGEDLSTALDAIARRAASLVDFVSSYRSLSTLPQARPERVHLGQLFARLAALVGPRWQARGGSAEFSVEPASLEVMVDPGQLEQALINLLKNAFEATEHVASPRATIVARLGRGGRLRIEVSDNGAGVPVDLAPHIFTPFFSTKKQGRGIGLAMVRQLVHGNGGTVRYARSVSNGARFIVSF
ncbi:sensor histidine kinase [Pseudoduganella umbonata]|uniref:histidine kinase n=1 Tax=Pseudoduganella umbonata TaxID=864828 RepID=A0A4P8HTV1_9BURK|nr:ATP-binding protein [Pseudoduganella umbonata]MBB3223885.1 C4-dicarboxylate-specific signal transduction histidine kinase [Pseudoduganella umbonata]QCP12706.1 ATP-binding protein [Pseudoduganella umbonata]